MLSPSQLTSRASLSDDNVHFANSALLIEKLTKAQIRGYESHFYPDS